MTFSIKVLIVFQFGAQTPFTLSDVIRPIPNVFMHLI